MKYTYKQAVAVLDEITPLLDDFLKSWAQTNGQDLEGLNWTKTNEARRDQGWVPGVRVDRWRPAEGDEIGLGERNLTRDILAQLSIRGVINYLRLGTIHVAVYDYDNGETVYVGRTLEECGNKVRKDLEKIWREAGEQQGWELDFPTNNTDFFEAYFEIWDDEGLTFYQERL